MLVAWYDHDINRATARYWHHQWAVILITRGGYRVGIYPQRVFDAEAGDLVIMRPETDHASTTVGHPRGAREAADPVDPRVRRGDARRSLTTPWICATEPLWTAREGTPVYCSGGSALSPPGPHRRCRPRVADAVVRYRVG